MQKNLFLSTFILLFGLLASGAFAQTTAVKATPVSGEVGSIAADKLVLKTAAGDVEAALSDKTQYFRVPPENPSIKAAVASSLAEIGVGDKVVVMGILSDDKKSMPAKSVYLMSKAAINERQQKSTADWRTRGTVGKVSKVDLMAKTITVSQRGFMGERLITVKPKADAEYFRYAPDSIEFAKAQKSRLAEIVLGDEIRILGNRNADGSEIEAEQIVTGSFQTSGGTIKSIDLAKNEVVITDSGTKKDVTIAISEISILKQFPQEMANRIATMQSGGGQGGGFRPPQGNGASNPPANPPTGGGQTNPPTGGGQAPNGMGGGGGFRNGGGIDDSRFQNIKITDLKVGEMIGVLSTKNTDPARIKAIKLFTGVEPFIKLSQMAAMRQGGGGNSGGGASLNIPGLDGFGGN
ncbi:MAG: hypothetical protein JSS81_02140 [Acidobacteria bacterium]|nr:hypothetical protein [Acidobacteriota bacterium]